MTGAPGYITTSLLNGMSFVEGWESRFFISKWSMQQLVCFGSHTLILSSNMFMQMTLLLSYKQRLKLFLFFASVARMPINLRIVG